MTPPPLTGYVKDAALVVTVEEISRIRMLEGCPVVVGTALGETLIRAQCRKEGCQGTLPPTLTSHTVWVRIISPVSPGMQCWQVFFTC